MKTEDKDRFCPLSDAGCETESQVCHFWRKREGCELEYLINDLRSIPNLLRRIENKLEEGKHLEGGK